VCLRNLSDCLQLKETKFRYWCFAHGKLTKEVFVPASTADEEDDGED
jgi:hypothetical protein